MLPPSISPIISVADASRTSRSGAKAAGLSRLVAAGFTVPEAFVVGTDCYRYHLWRSGARELAAAPAEAEEREQIRDLILQTDIPSEVWEAVLEACERLDGECGVPELRLVVRASAVEGPSRLHFPGAYEAYLGITTPEELSAAIRRVWASLWSGKAAAYRARHERQWEPVMAVIVQRMVSAEQLGSASTANIVTGDPTKVLVSSWPAANPTDSTHREVDLRLASYPEQGHKTEIAEQAVLVEDAFGGPVEIEWAMENGRLQLLQARKLDGLPPYFPTENLPHQPGRGDWRRVTRQPISHLARSLMPRSGDRRRQGDTAVHVNGYVYASGGETAQAGKSASHTCGKEVVAAAELLREWNTRASAQLRDQIDEVMGADTAPLDQSGLMRLLEQAASASCCARGWLLDAAPLCRRLPELLRDLLRDVPGVDDPEAATQRLMAGIEGPAFMRVARVQDLGDRLSLAWDSGRIEDETRRRDFARSVRLFAREYGGSFSDPLEVHDIACWRGWLEDLDTLWRTIEAATARDGGPSLVTHHVAAQVAAIEEAGRLADRLKGATRKRFEELVKLARDGAALYDEAEHACALASAALRGILAELAGRMIGAGLIGKRCDIFYLSLDELLAVSLKPSPTEQMATRAKVAQHKHALWLEQRLAAPIVISGSAGLD